MWNNSSIGILILKLFALYLFLLGYFQVQPTFEDINLNKSSNNEPMKIILLLVDALRIDLFANKNITFYQEMKEKNEEYQILYHGISSTPSATQLNLKSITTGNFPAFVDFGSNMAAQELKEDNIIYSMKRNNKTIALLGDDTWFHMFPRSFDYKFVSESFDVRDIDTDDNIIFNTIEQLMKENKYDFIVGHLLGIDHSGHGSNDSNKQLWDKQKQYSNLLYKIYNQMDNNTMLFVVGDHGMSQDGNHGGDSPYEVSSTIYGINKQYKFNKTLFNQTINNRQYLNQQLIDRNQYVRQALSINLAPTISYLMGISIPFSNMGAILSEMIKTKESQQNSCIENLNQVMNYINKLQKPQGNLDLNLIRYDQNQQSHEYNCHNIQEILLDLQIEIKEKVKTHDYQFLYLGVYLMITLFAFQTMKLMQYLFEKQFLHQNHYIIYRIEFFIIILPVAIFVYLLFSLQLSLKFISVYVIFAIFKQIIVPVAQIKNIRVIFTKIMNPLPHYRQYFFIFTNIIVQKGMQELSLQRQMVLSTNSFGSLLNIFIILFITQTRLLKQCLFVLIVLSLLLLAEQYNASHLTTLPPSPLTLVRFNYIFESPWIKFILPIYFLQKILYKLKFKKCFYIFLGLAQFICLINHSVNLSELKGKGFIDVDIDFVKLIKVYLPLFLYICSITMTVIFCDFSYFFLITLTVSGKQGIIIYCCLFYSIYYLMKFFLKIDRSWLPPIAGATIQLILNFSWCCLGHRMSFSNVKFQDSLIGTETFNVLFNTTLLMINIFGVFTTLDIIKKITFHILKNDENKDNKFTLYYFNNNIIDWLIVIQFSQITFSALHCQRNLSHLRVVELFAEKLVYETITFIVIVIIRFIGIMQERFDPLKKCDQYSQQYQTIIADTKDQDNE